MPNLRRLVPSTSLLTHSRLLFLPVDAVDWVVARLFPETRGIPPARFRARTGIVNRFVFNQVQFRFRSVPFWTHAFRSGWINLESSILDLGSGCGRYAIGLRRTSWMGSGYTGAYTGIDVDEEMIRWCQASYPANFRFVHVDVYNRVYNPSGPPASEVDLPVESATQDLVFGMSLLTHLLEADLRNYLHEAHRALKPGGRMVMSTFCVEHLAEHLGTRWSFEHRRGEAYIENEKYPEAAVAYRRGFLLGVAEEVGFSDVSLEGAPQTILMGTR